MMSEEMTDNLLQSVFNSPMKFNSCKRWLSNFKLQAQSEGLQEENDKQLTQADFIAYFLCFLRERASKVKSGLSHTLEENFVPSIRKVNTINHGNIEFKKSDNEEYNHHFPVLGENKNGKCIKSMRRINPTPISNEISEDNKKYVDNSSISFITKNEEELFKKRFSSKTNSSCRASFNSSKKQKETISTLKKKKIIFNEERLIILRRIVDLYFILLKYSFVPNLTNEVKFLLHMFSLIGSYKGEIICPCETDFYNILMNSNDWQFFCIEVFLKIDFVFIKMDYLIRNFLHTHITAYRNQAQHSTTDISSFLGKIKSLSNVSSMKFVSFQKLTESKSELLSDTNILDNIRKSFFAIEDTWKKECAEEELFTKLEYLLSFKNNISWLNSFGKIFVDSLIINLEESCTKNMNIEQRCSNLTPRFVKPSEIDEHSFMYNEIFHKLVIDFCFKNCSKHLLYIKFWMFYTIKLLSNRNFTDYGSTVSADTRNSVTSALKIKISLAKFLGYVIFSSGKVSDNTSDSERLILETIEGEFMPPVDIKDFILRAYKGGQLVDAIPWIAQYLCMSDKRIANQPYYSDVLLTLISLHLSVGFKIEDEDELKNLVTKENKKDPLLRISIVIPHLGIKNTQHSELDSVFIVLKESALLFIKLWTGKLFEGKLLGEDIFFKLFNNFIKIQDLIKPNKGVHFPKKSMDCSTIINDEDFLVLCSHFSKMKYWESTHSLTIVRNIRPSMINSAGDLAVDVQVLLQEQFLRDNQNISNIIDFVNNNVFLVFQKAFFSEIRDISDRSTTTTESTSCLISEKLQFLISDCHERIFNCLKALMVNDLDSAIYEVTVSICLKKLNQEINDWLILQGFDSVVDKEFKLTSLKGNNSCTIPASLKFDSLQEPFTFDVDNELDHKLSVFLKNMATVMRKLKNEEQVEHDVKSFLNEIFMISHNLYPNVGRKNLEDLYFLSWNYVLLIVTKQPQLITEEFYEKISLFWKEHNYGNCENRILCPLVIKSCGMKNKHIQKLIAQNIGQLIFWIIERDILNYENLEEECVAILQHSWNKTELDFILKAFSEIKNSLSDSKMKNSVQLINMIDALAESIIEIKLIE